MIKRLANKIVCAIKGHDPIQGDVDFFAAPSVPVYSIVCGRCGKEV